MREACRFHFMVPFLAMAKLERARFCAWLIEALLLVVKVLFVVFPNSAGIVSPQALCFGVYLAAGRIGNFSCFSPSAGRVFC